MVALLKRYNTTNSTLISLNYHLSRLKDLYLTRSPLPGNGLLISLKFWGGVGMSKLHGTCHASAMADPVTATGHNVKWDHFEILAKGRSDTHCKIKETLLIQELKPYPKRKCQ